MAQDWCVWYGILPAAQHHKIYLQVCKRKGIKPVAGGEGGGNAGAAAAGGSPVKKGAAEGRKRKVEADD